MRIGGKVAATLISAAAVLLGLADAPEQAARWAGWLRAFKAAVPWWLLILAGLVVLILLWGPSLWQAIQGFWPARRSSPDPNAVDPATGRRFSQYRESETVLQEKVRFLEASAKLHEDQYRYELEQLVAEKATLESERKQLAEKCARLELDCFRYWALWTYGAEFMEVDQQPSAEQKAAIREKIDEMRTGLGLMLEPAYKVWERVAERMRGEGEDSFAHSHSETVSEGMHDSLKHSHQRLLGMLDHSTDDPRAQFVMTYKLYWRFRSAIGRCAHIQNVILDGWPEFKAWHEGAVEFNKDFRRIVGTKPQSEGLKLFREVQTVIRAFHAGFHTDALGKAKLVPGLPPGPFNLDT